MFRFTFRFLIMFFLLIFGILMGMGIAEKGMARVTGNSGNIQSFQIQRNNEQMEVHVLGKTYVSELPDQIKGSDSSEPSVSNENSESKKGADEMRFISKFGDQLGFVFQKGAEKGLNMLADLIN